MFLMHWSFKTGYHEIAAKKFIATGAPFPECKSWKRFHGPGSLKGWILVEADNADACYEHAAEWAEIMDWEVTPVVRSAFLQLRIILSDYVGHKA